ncbi:MAG: tetratricopeptide repeat protein, partial [Candidatus Omnitrophica bacterium]|nr:tetratricopeptide repeat protein [Candidatus Omnitrophota bacterium]
FLMLFIFLSLKYAQARRRVLFGLLWAAVFLMPASSLLIFSLLAVGETVSHTVVSESWAYPACAGIFFIAGDIGQKLYRLLPRKIVCGGFLAVMIALGALTIERNSIWAGDAVLFYRQILTFQPRNSVVYYNMGNEYLARGSHAEAEEAYLKALTLNPQYLYARNNLCNLYVRTGRFEEAVRECQRVIAQAPGLTRAYVNLENAYTAVRRRKQ